MNIGYVPSFLRIKIIKIKRILFTNQSVLISTRPPGKV